MAAGNEELAQVARWLDGEQVELSARQRALAEEVLADEAVVGRALGTPLPAGVLHRVLARLGARGVRPARRGRLAAALAAAAVVVVAAAALWLVGRGAPTPTAPEYVEQFLQPPAGALEAQAEALSEELAETQVRLALGDDLPVEAAVTALAEELGELMAEDGAASGLDIWEGAL